MYTGEVLQPQTYIKGGCFPHCFATTAIYEAWQAAGCFYLPLSPLQNKPCPPVLCIRISVFQISLGSRWFRVFEIAKTKGDKINELHYPGQSSNQTSVSPLTLLCKATKIIAKPDNRDLSTEEKGIIEFISPKQLTLGP